MHVYIWNLFLVLPYAYHCGFNLGYNIAEAVNFGTIDWIPFGINSVNWNCNEKKLMFTMSMDPFIFYENQIKKLTNEYENEIENLKEEQFYASKREFEENSRLNV